MKKILSAAIIAAFGISMMAQTGVSLKFNPEKNKLYSLKASSEQTITQTVNGVQQVVESHVDYAISLKMIDLTPDFMITEIHIDTLVTKTNTMGKTINISSANEGDIKSLEMADIMSAIMNRLSKNSLYVKIDFAGKPLEIVNAKILAGVILKDTSSITLTGPTAAAVKTQVAGTVSDDNLKAMISMFTWCLPAREVAEGGDWEVKQQMNSGGMLLDVITTYHLKKIDGKNAIVSAESHVKAAENASPIKSGGANVTYDNLQGFGKSDMVIDVLTGLVIEEVVKTHITGNLGVSAPGLSMQIPMDINGESKVWSPR